MQLLVDVGNTRMKWAYWDGEISDPCSSIHKGTNFDRLLHHVWRDSIRPDRVLISNVVGNEIKEAISSWVETLWHLKAEFIQTESQAFGVQNGYKDPYTLGIDRWLAMIAAFRHFKGREPVCVIDCGTCLTVDVVDKTGIHLGGLLIPGTYSMREVLTSCTQSSPMKQDIQFNDGLLARNTYDGMMGGTLFASVAYIERLLLEIQREFTDPLKVIMTGGEALSLKKLISQDVFYKPDLVLEGLGYYADLQDIKSGHIREHVDYLSLGLNS